LVASTPAPATLLFDVDAQYSGNISAALAAAAVALNGSSSSAAHVLLGDHTYALSGELRVPDNTALLGHPGGATHLFFSLAASNAPSRTPAIAAESNTTLANFALTLFSARAYTPAVHALGGSVNFTAHALTVSLQQSNVSNAFYIDNVEGWRVEDCNITQGGVCLWPPRDDNTDFPDSVTFRTQGATNGFFSRNSMTWHCSAFDMDTSSRLVFEHNHVACVDPGTIPHGNSISSYGFRATPYAQSVFFAHNLQTRPPFNNKSDWAFHETLTTDGPGGFGAGNLSALEEDTISLAPGGLLGGDPTGSSAVVVAGPGTGQFRLVLSRVNDTALRLARPFDQHVVPGTSVVSVVASVGGKIVAGNTFSWGSVVQQFGTGLGGVFAENTFDWQDNCGADSGAIDGSLTGFGLCYGNQPQSMFFFEYRGNVMNNSNGISLHDVSPTNTLGCNSSTYAGPFIRWASVTGNRIAGIAPCSPGVCGSINATNSLTTDLLVEGNDVSAGCTGGNLLPCENGVCVQASFSVVDNNNKYIKR